MRQAHTKSRTGCRTCKTRKIKCDEQRPACRNCVRHGVDCDFVSNSSSGASPPTVIMQPQTPRVRASIESQLLDLELLHHYTVSTSLTMSHDTAARNFYRVAIPQIGFRNPYVLKIVLALSALHLAFVNPEQKDSYLAWSETYHSESTSAMQQISAVTVNNYAGVLAFTWLNTYYSFARPRQSVEFLIIDNGLVPDWLLLFRGVRMMREAGEYAHHSSLFAAGSQTAMEAHDAWSNTTYQNEALTDLEVAFRKEVKTVAKLETLCNAVDRLRRSFGLFFEGGHSEEHQLRGAFIWVYTVGDAFVDLLKAADNEALCVLAFFCVLLQRLNHYWWLDGWGRHLIRTIHAAVSPKHGLWIQWALEETGSVALT